jgi:hypothetical protein
LYSGRASKGRWRDVGWRRRPLSLPFSNPSLPTRSTKRGAGAGAAPRPPPLTLTSPILGAQHIPDAPPTLGSQPRTQQASRC